MLRTSDAAKRLGVHPQTLRTWEREGKINPCRTPNGQRRYKISTIVELQRAIERRKVIYCRVSSKKQEEDLRRQQEFMQRLFPTHDVITDIGSGVNFKRPGLQNILDRVCDGDVEEIAISYKDRLCRIGYELLEHLFEKFGCKIVVINNIETSPERELVEDLIAITTSFSARIHGLRKYSREIKNDTFKEEVDPQIVEKVDSSV